MKFFIFRQKLVSENDAEFDQITSSNDFITH